MLILDEIKALKSGKKELRNFGLTMGVVLAVITGFLLWKEKETYIYFLIISLFFLTGGFAFRPVLKPIYYVWMTFAIILGWVMTRVIVCIIFYMALTPIAIISKLAGKKFLAIEIHKETSTYWKKRESSTFDKKKYERQF